LESETCAFTSIISNAHLVVEVHILAGVVHLVDEWIDKSQWCLSSIESVLVEEGDDRTPERSRGGSATS